MPLGIVFAANDLQTLTPQHEEWEDISNGDNLTGLPVLSPIKLLKWTYPAAKACRLDWIPLKGQVLSSLTCTEYGQVDRYQRYSDAKCYSVKWGKDLGRLTDLEIIFLVNTESGTL